MNLTAVLLLAFCLFVIGIAVCLVRRELLFILMGVEIMFNASVLVAVAGAHYWHNTTGQILALFIMVLAGAELVVALVIIMFCYRYLKKESMDQLTALRDHHAVEAQ